MVALGGISILFLMLAFGLPVAFAMAVSGAAGLLMIGGVDMVMGILETVPFSTANSYEMITIPMFILMAEFVILSGVANDLFAAAAKWVGRVPGGLGMATAVAGAGFGAISGSSTASAATLSSTSIPAMLAQGYEPKLAGGVVAISGTLAMLIPPSIALVLYGIIADVSIGALLVGGIIPGILVTLTIVLTVYLLVIQDRSRAPAGRSYTLREKIASLKVCGAMILLFSGVTGTIYAGIATPTEAAGIGAFGAFLLALRSGNLTAATLRAALVRAVHATAMILMIMLGAHVFGTFFTLTQITQDLVHWVGSLDVSPWVIMALILFGYVLLGCVMDQIAILILTVPVVLPVVLSLGFDPVWFGVIVVITAEVGMVTPPMGLNVFVVARYTGRPLEEIFAGVMPHVVAHLILIAVLTAFPQIITWLPSTMRY
ncbi:TRAP transporter large permease [Azospirillum sp. TSA2s]|uniref:TRAP transporter large permease n=1 Tax=Azospirillum sp. TSA2s TaxID=709810 RepID=UPI0010AA5778|nr:TRAP transporter large permease [Azospirillum sp. TSA2s]QCG93362.1 TRAP transporter large permease [Azospirillum sp. TSA2s]